MLTARPVTPRPSPSLSPCPSRHRAPGSGIPAPGLAPHGAAPLAAERLLLLPVPVPGGARAAREGAAGQSWLSSDRNTCAYHLVLPQDSKPDFRQFNQLNTVNSFLEAQ
ncbi:melanoregulin isoform X4 [Rattus norvegicus]|uniref:melanoregulin isoform X4 n=1 Tax=Rattus norvegicus TaxID=10116 RepID=UPI002FD7AA24